MAKKKLSVDDHMKSHHPFCQSEFARWRGLNSASVWACVCDVAERFDKLSKEQTCQKK